MKKLKRIYWETKYSVYDDNLDRQHQYLFEITNQMIDEYEEGKDDCREILAKLVSYISEHFKAEQHVMMKMRFWAYDKHEKEHQKFIEKVEEFINACRENPEGINFEILSFLQDWLSTHIANYDLKYGELLKISRRL
ncbi:MAG TPA: bacteriohemerythrin [Smithellaceae bacterium]|mgnify:CR=1 FL=1|nr:bacteriohemerythrin [Smithellaceae bacterium]HRS90159.1 bacteriohemerythrin [Smithellaceae bacterium]HRV27019.1 bacteriohemerythrin [Smithellaceae bacterium]